MFARSTLFALTLAGSAAMLFAVQPLVARLALPTLGGTPGVWNVCMLFFQAAVLGGYALAHALASRTCRRVQAGVFLALIVLGSVSLPLTLGTDAAVAAAHPLSWLLGELTRGLGVPALALATASPLLQQWFAGAAGRGRDPYVLYAASNVGSLGALLAYPFLVEPHWTLLQQAGYWRAGYVAWGLLVLLCAVLVLRTEREEPRGEPAASAPGNVGQEPAAEAVGGATWKLWATWVGLAAIPASLLQGCTLHLTTDVASVPLLWVGPLALYLSTFVVAFWARGGAVVRVTARVMPFLGVALLYLVLMRATQPVLVLMLLHLAYLWVASLVCHGRLVALRPAPTRLTGFYLAMSIGGVLGGAFSSLAAPRLFTSVAEYPWAISLACLALPVRRRRGVAECGSPLPLSPPAQPTPPTPARPGAQAPEDWSTPQPSVPPPAQRTPRVLECGSPLPLPPPAQPSAQAPEDWRLRAEWLGHFGWAAAIGGIVVVLGLILPWFLGEGMRARNALVFAPAAILCCALLDRPGRLALAMGVTFATGSWLHSVWAGDQFAERNFFGITRVTRDGAGEFHQLVHGNTFHGRQFRDPQRRDQPLTYYHREGPLGRLMEVFQRQPGKRRIGVIGLGAGSMAAYARPNEDWTFYEIDPAVIRVARDSRWFTYLADCRARQWRVVEGDARRRLQEAPEGAYDLLVLDAFSSDAIPVHLLTVEAISLYQNKLAAGGWLAIHISNRYLDLEPLVAALARERGWVCRSSDDSAENDHPGKEASHWLVLARSEADLGRVVKQSIWARAEGADRVAPWTDQRASVFQVFDWH